MVKYVYSMRDKKASVYHLPFYNDSPELAKRSIKMAMMRDNSLPMVLTPDDYQLWELGEFHDILGNLENYKDKKFVCEIKELAEQIQQETIWKEVIADQIRSEQEKFEKKTRKEKTDK